MIFSILNVGGKLEMKIEKGHNINLNISSYYENLIQEKPKIRKQKSS